MKVLILKAINDWNETEFKRLNSIIDLYEIKDYISTIRSELYLLRSEAEKNEEKEKIKRIDRFINSINQF